MKKFTQGDEEFEGVQWTVDIEGEQELAAFTGGKVIPQETNDGVIIDFEKTGVILDPFDWVLKDKNGNYRFHSDDEVTAQYDSEGDFWVECNVCKAHLKNWSGSTPCCGSIAYIVEDGVATKSLSLFTSLGGGPISATRIDPAKE